MTLILSKDGVEITVGDLCYHDKNRGWYFYESRITKLSEGVIDTDTLSDMFKGHLLEGHPIIGLEMFMKTYQNEGSLLNVIVGKEIK